MLVRPCVSLNTSIRSPLMRRSSRVVRPRAFSLSGYGRSVNSGTMAVARLWTCSSRQISFFRWGDQLWHAYSKWGHTNDLYTDLSISSSMYITVRFTQPWIEFALAAILAIWLPNLKLSETYTPRSFSSCETDKFLSFKVYEWRGLLKPKWTTLHLASLNLRSHFLLQFSRLDRSLCRQHQLDLWLRGTI